MERQEWDIDPAEITIRENEILGQGQFCTVYKAEWRLMTVAVKRFNADADLMDRKYLEKEMDVLMKMHHPHIIHMLGICWKPLMIVLEYMDGGNLRDALDQFQRWPGFCTFHQRLEWSMQLCIAVAYLHGRRPAHIIHRDIKPSNIMIDAFRRLKIVDFGTSKMCAQIKTHLSRESLPGLDTPMTCCIGTPFYMAPEIRVGDCESYDRSVDIWAVGLVLYEMWEMCDIRSMDCTVDEFYQYWSPVFCRTPRALRSTIASCLSKSPTRRPTVQDIFQQLKALRICRCFA